MAEVKTYDAKKVQVLINGIPMSGFPEGTFLTIPATEEWTKTIGADGKVSRTASNNKTAEIPLVLEQTSGSNDVLSALLLADRVSNAGFFTLAVADLNGTTLHFYPECWLKGKAEEGFSNDLEDRTWTIDTGQPLENFVGGTN